MLGGGTGGPPSVLKLPRLGGQLIFMAPAFRPFYTSAVTPEDHRPVRWRQAIPGLPASSREATHIAVSGDSLRISGVTFVVFAALAVHAPGGLEHVPRMEAAEGTCLEDLIHRVLGDHHPLRRVRNRQRLVEDPIKDPYHPPPQPGPGHETQASTSRGLLY